MDQRLADSWGQFLSQFSWDWFVTLTFRGDPSQPWGRGFRRDSQVSSFHAHRLFARFMRDLERSSGQPIYWFRGDEYGLVNGRFHIHALVGNVAAERRLYWMDRWERLAGFARILPFDPEQGAAHYCAKYVTKQFGDWDLSDNIRAFHQYQHPLREQTDAK